MSEEGLTLRIRILDAMKAREQLRSVATATGEVTVAADAAGKRGAAGFGALGSGIKGMGAALGLSGLAIGLGDAVKGGMKLQLAQGQAQAALTATGRAGADAYQRIQDAADRLSTHGGFEAPAQIAGMAALVRETKSVNDAVRGNALATALARGRNIDYASALSTVQRAYGGSIGRLQQLLGPMVAVKSAAFGLTQAHKEQALALTAQAKAMGPAGAAWLAQQRVIQDLTPAQRALVALQDKHATSLEVLTAATRIFSGATQSYSNTTAGKLSNLRQGVTNLKDSIGLALLPTVDKLIGLGSAVAGFFSRNRGLAEALGIAVTALGLTALGRYLVGGLVETVVWLGTSAAAFGAWAAGVAIDLGLADAAMTLFGVTSGVAITIATGGLILVVAAVIAAVALIVMNFDTVKKAGEAAWHWIEGAAKDAWDWIKGHWPLVGALIAGPFGVAVAEIVTHFKQIENFVVGVFNKVKHAASDAGRWVGNAFHNVVSAPGNALSAITGGLLASGGIVPMHFAVGGPVMAAPASLAAVRHLAVGGPSGTDTVPAWLTPGEQVLTQATVNRLGAPAVSALEAGDVQGLTGILGRQYGGGGGGGSISIVPGQVNVKIDARTIAQAVVQYTLQRAARGPSSLVGGSLVSGAPGPTVG